MQTSKPSYASARSRACPTEAPGLASVWRAARVTVYTWQVVPIHAVGENNVYTLLLQTVCNRSSPKEVGL